MARSYLDPSRPICALATPPGRGALALVRAAGPGCLELAASCFSRPAALLDAPGHSLVHGALLDPASGEAVDELLAAVFRGPRSFTGEDQVEFTCHGSPETVGRILGILEAAGFSRALPGEFSFRAFANGKTDLLRAEAVDEIIHARSEAARVEALRRLEGGLSRRVGEARAGLVELLAEAEVRLDHAEEDGSPAEALPPAAIRGLRDRLASLAASFAIGRLRREGARLALAGRPNAGKSSLFNLLLREERALVSPEAGTTRDWIEAGIEVAGFPLRLIDTAGLREGEGAVEAAGVARSRRILAESELLLYLVDASGAGAGSDAAAGPESHFGPEDRAILAERPDAIIVWNKVDLPGARPAPAGAIAVSATTGAGLPALHAAIEDRLRELTSPSPAGRALAGRAAAEESVVVAGQRQKELLDRAVAALEAAAEAVEAGAALDAAVLDLREAAELLGEMTGEIAGPEVIEAIFSRFCLGK